MSRTVTSAQPRDVDDLTAAALSQLTGTTVLNCLGKQPGPPSLGADFARIVDLPQRVRDDLWAVLEPNLRAINTPDTDRVVAAFCDRHRIAPPAVAAVIGACRFLFKNGAERNTSAEQMREDIEQLLAGGAVEERRAVLAAVMACYERAAPRLRVQAVHEALTDHGRVVTDVKWRVDEIRQGNTGEAINVPVTLLTLRFREGDQSGQLTVQLLPNELKMLHDACARALG